MRNLILVLTILAFAIGVLAYPAAKIVDAVAGTDALIVDAVDDESVDVNRGLRELEDDADRGPVADIYGTPADSSVRLVFADPGKLLHPEEDPSLTLYLKRGEDHPLQAQLLYFFAVRSTIAGILFGAIGAFLVRRMRKPAPVPEPEPA